MTNAHKHETPLAKNESEQLMLREMARDMGVALYRRYSEGEAAKLLNINARELERLRAEGQIAYLHIGGAHISFFGCQLLTFLLDCIVPVGVTPRTQPEAGTSPPKPAVNSAAELVSVKESMALLGIGRTKLYELINAQEVESVKIGTRTLIKQASLRRFTEVARD